MTFCKAAILRDVEDKVSGARRICEILLFCFAMAIASPAQTFKTLLDFDQTNGADPVYPSLIQGFNGAYYGTTLAGGANDAGTVFKISSGGTLTTLYSFCSQANCTDGASPYAGLVQATDGNFYGTTSSGGANVSYGTVFKITPAGILTTLHSFDLTDGALPFAALVQATNGDFYGTTSGGGSSNNGTIFKITQGGTLTTLHTFAGSDGGGPVGALIQGTNGDLYGTTPYGGAIGNGTVFKITPGGTLTTLHSFGSTDGSYPYCGLFQATNGSFYGTTYQGANNSTCGAGNGCGTIFEVTPDGTLMTLLIFDSTDGANPIAGLVQATDGNFYGTTYAGGSTDWGTVFKITPSGTLTTLHSFDLTDGAQPYGPVAQGTDGNFYGTATNGGTGNAGTVFTLSVGLAEFVETLPTIGRAGSKVMILGNDLMGATSVSFNGTAATFTVVSKTEIRTAVPTGATSGSIQVTTPSGTLTSNVAFRVK